MFSAIEPFLKRINNIHLQEKSLYSDHLQTAGRVDCIAEFDARLSVIDFKTSSKPKSAEWITNYFVKALRMQSCTKNVQAYLSTLLLF